MYIRQLAHRLQQQQQNRTRIVNMEIYIGVRKRICFFLANEMQLALLLGLSLSALLLA